MINVIIDVYKRQVWDKVKEEIQEFQAEVAHMDKEKAEAEFGDVMFSLINAARLYKINPDNALEQTNQKMCIRDRYNPADVEGKWYQYWLDHKLFSSKPDGREDVYKRQPESHPRQYF